MSTRRCAVRAARKRSSDEKRRSGSRPPSLLGVLSTALVRKEYGSMSDVRPMGMLIATRSWPSGEATNLTADCSWSPTGPAQLKLNARALLAPASSSEAHDTKSQAPVEYSHRPACANKTIRDPSATKLMSRTQHSCRLAAFACHSGVA